MLITALILSLTGIIVAFIYSPKSFGYMTVKDFNEIFQAEKSLREGLQLDLRTARNEIEAKRKLLAEARNPIDIKPKRSDWVILPDKDTKKPVKKPAKKAAMRKTKK